MIKNFFWVVLGLTVLIWIGVGIYYLKPSPEDNKLKFVTPPQPTESPVFESLEQTHFITGSFEDWEEIEGSEDRYILLSNPETKGNYPKIKVVLKFSNSYKNDVFWEGMTAFSVEKGEEEYDDLGYLKDFTSEEINELIKKGDSITVIFEREAVIEKSEENADDDFLALSISIKRIEGKTTVEKELGREI